MNVSVCVFEYTDTLIMLEELSLNRVAEVFENERYQLSLMNWSAGGLLMTDR